MSRKAADDRKETTTRELKSKADQDENSFGSFIKRKKAEGERERGRGKRNLETVKVIRKRTTAVRRKVCASKWLL